MNVNISIHHDGKNHKYSLEDNTPIAYFLREKGLIAQACGSAGTCGKCRIIANTTPSDAEKKKLNKQALDSGIRLACYTNICEGLEIQIIEQAELTVLTDYIEQDYTFQPLVDMLALELDPAHIDDQRDDLRRVLEAANCQTHTLNLKEITELSHAVHDNSSIQVLRYKDTLLGLAKQKAHLAIAVDIGTTTIAATLIDLSNNTVIAVAGEANAQASWGADVISRINQTIPETSKDYQKNITALQSAVVQQIESLRKHLLKEANLGIDDVHYITIAGNTTMMHMFAGLPAKNISRAPFIPVCMEAMRLRATELNMQSNAHVFLMPSIAGYIGADIVAAMLAVNAHTSKKPFLLLDLGTNAEIVLGYEGKFITCSAAAGPCFEGASLACGMAGQSGAINYLKLSADKTSFECKTINDAPIKGICGSGVLDCVAMLLEANALDETGLLEGEDSSLKASISKTSDGQTCLVFNENVNFTQRDIREIQLAKAAVRAGIHTLIEEAGLSVDDIEHLYIAGGFGSAMNPESAACIGLIPPELLHCTRAIGNGASLGVIRYATEKNVDAHVKYIVDNTRYLELSALPTFTNLYVEHMIFM